MMNRAHSDKKFTFQTQFYYVLGDFVTEIDGWHGGATRYWALYVNNVQTSCGIDTQLLNPGDAVSFRMVSVSDKKRHDGSSVQAKLHELRNKKRVD